LKSSAKKHTPNYTLKVRYEPASKTTVWEDKQVTGTFMEWFNTDGSLQHQELKRWLARNIEVIGLADPESKQVTENKHDDIVADVMLASMTTSSRAAEQTAAAKGKKSRRKA
jgi:ketosteroid isomerase-like protein